MDFTHSKVFSDLFKREINNSDVVAINVVVVFDWSYTWTECLTPGSSNKRVEQEVDIQQDQRLPQLQ